jgi:hypothetical protein
VQPLLFHVVLLLLLVLLLQVSLVQLFNALQMNAAKIFARVSHAIMGTTCQIQTRNVSVTHALNQSAVYQQHVLPHLLWLLSYVLLVIVLSLHLRIKSFVVVNAQSLRAVIK